MITWRAMANETPQLS